MLVLMAWKKYSELYCMPGYTELNSPSSFQNVATTLGFARQIIDFTSFVSHSVDLRFDLTSFLITDLFCVYFIARSRLFSTKSC